MKKWNKKAVEDSFKTLFFAFVFVGLSGVLLYTALTEIAGAYDKDMSELDGSVLNLQQFNISISDFEQSGKDFQDTFANTTDKSAFEDIFDLVGFLTVGMWNIATGMIKLIILPFNLILNILSNLFGVSSITISVLIGGLAILTIFAIYRLTKTGD